VLRSRKEPIYLIRVITVVLVSGGESRSRVAKEG
jgi:hypothetical protein